MRTVSFQCPKCECQSQVYYRFAGRRVRCVHCGTFASVEGPRKQSSEPVQTQVESNRHQLAPESAVVQYQNA